MKGIKIGKDLELWECLIKLSGLDINECGNRKNGKPHFCRICGRGFKMEWGLERHIKNEHNSEMSELRTANISNRKPDLILKPKFIKEPKCA